LQKEALLEAKAIWVCWWYGFDRLEGVVLG